MMRYKCIKAFSIPECDEEGFITEKYLPVKKGTMWELDDSGYSFVGGDVRLETVDPISGRWLEITEDTLEEYFEEVLGDA